MLFFCPHIQIMLKDSQILNIKNMLSEFSIAVQQANSRMRGQQIQQKIRGGGENTEQEQMCKFHSKKKKLRLSELNT